MDERKAREQLSSVLDGETIGVMAAGLAQLTPPPAIEHRSVVSLDELVPSASICQFANFHAAQCGVSG
ncbi:hypothetical protein [Halalkalicoccus salilacus]|uniref:hypothetical protein n=1 Tax=Halalkalicoccus TaxID=332246 RepID=UPI002F96584A